jgi:hypothetical protein
MADDKRIPKVGMRFRDSDEAWDFWVEYGGHIGFEKLLTHFGIGSLLLTYAKCKNLMTASLPFVFCMYCHKPLNLKRFVQFQYRI